MVEKIATSGEKQLAEVTPTQSQIAYREFIRASNLHPSSIPQQATEIAMQCKEEGLDPLILRDALLEDRKRIDDIVRVANHAHQRAGTRLRPINSELVREIVGIAFNTASELRGYPDSYLKNKLKGKK